MKYTIRQRDNGNYYTRISFRDPDGKLKWKKFTARTKSDLRKAVADYAADHNDYNAGSFRSEMERYISDKKSVLSPSTLRTYLGYQKKLNSQYGSFVNMYVDRIRTSDLQKLVNGLVSSGLCAKSVHDYLGFVQAVIGYSGFIVKQARLPEIRRADPATPNAAAVRQMLADVKGTSVEIPFRLSLYGLRRGEICALNPLEDLNGTVLHVHHSMAYLPLSEGQSVRQKVIKSPKTPQSDRFIQIDKDLAAKIRGLDHVTDYAPDRLSKKMGMFLKRYNPDYHMHTLRHFFASYLHEQGVPDADILSAGGWKTDNVMKSVYRQSLDPGRASAAIMAFSDDSEKGSKKGV